MRQDLVIKNLRYLIDSDEFNQTAIALMFGVKQNTFNGYINGKSKRIPIRILEKFSCRYDVTIDDLLHKDLSYEFEVLDNLDFDKLCDNIELVMFPRFRSKNISNNKIFEEALKLTGKAFNCNTIEEFNKNVCIYEHAIDLYKAVWEDTQNCVALINSISLLLWIFYRYTPSTIRLEQSLNNKNVFGLPEVRYGLLYDPSKKTCDKYERKRKAFLEKYHDLVYDYIKELKHNLDFVDLGDFYLTLCNIFNFVEAEDSSEYDSTACRKAAERMLIQQYYMGNKYAKRYVDLFAV